MKNRLTAFLRKASITAFVGFLLAVFFAPSIRICSEDVFRFESLPAEYYGDLVTSKPHQKLSDYEWFYSIEVIHYNDGSVDTFIAAPGVKRDFTGVSYYESLGKVEDAWFMDKDHCMGSWKRTYTGLPNEKRHHVELRPADEFKPETFFVVELPEQSRRRVSTASYFSLMRYASRLADDSLKEELFRQPRSALTEQLLKEREGRPKLRPFLAHLSFQMFGGKGLRPELYALQEAQSLALYVDNWIIDEKRADISRAQLTITSSHFRMLAERLIKQLSSGEPKGGLLRDMFNKSNSMSYEGQLIEVEQLNKERVLEGNMLVHEGLFTELLYSDRCAFLNAPYAFSLWSGAYLAGAFQSDLAALWSIGLDLGEGLQVLNDWRDFLSGGQGYDGKNNRMTLPHFFAMKFKDDPEKGALIQDEVAAVLNHRRKEAAMLAERLPDGEAKELLLLAIGILKI